MVIQGFGESKDIETSNLLKLFHGSNEVIQKPVILKGGFKKDFGDGFYLTNLESQAARFTRKFLRRKNTARRIVNTYYIDNCAFTDLNCKIFDGTTEEWLDFIVECRKKGKYYQHGYDLIEGPMADDQVWNTVEDYIKGIINREQFFVLLKFEYPTHQICLSTEKALSYLKFSESYEVV